MTQKFQDNYDVQVCHAWGMTEMSPLGTLGTLKPEYAGLTGEARLDVQMKQGHPPFGVEMKIVDDERPRTAARRQDLRPAQGARAIGGARLFQGRGAASSTPRAISTPATSPPSTRYGYMQITDRSKDVIKSGGEWISSIDLENLAVGHPKVAEAAVIGVRHPKWDERPLLVVVLKDGQIATKDEMLAFMRRQDRQMVDARRRRLRRARFPTPPPARSRRPRCASNSRITLFQPERSHSDTARTAKSSVPSSA